ncbi:unnamed protein product [Lactuca saligna]|uniref:Uncharacterized protein n=1 Tax=Lactuca saligna TaxID=75948 RepID=A0AA35YUL2_LACSI|nr:unnamed protein product [Lactuca saligna]
MAASIDNNNGRGTDPSVVLVSNSNTCVGNNCNDLQWFPLGHSRHPTTKLDTRWSSVAHGGDEGRAINERTTAIHMHSFPGFHRYSLLPVTGAFDDAMWSGWQRRWRWVRRVWRLEDEEHLGLGLV